MLGLVVLMLEDKHDLGVGGIDRVLIVSNFIVNFSLYPCQILFNCLYILIFGIWNQFQGVEQKNTK